MNEQNPAHYIESEHYNFSEKSISWPAPLMDAACAIASQKWVVILILTLGITAGAIRLITLPTIFKASSVAVLMSREKPMLDAIIDTSSIEMSTDRTSRGEAGSLMLPPDPTLYATLIKSRAVLSRIALKFSIELSGHLSPKDRSDEVVQQLKSMVQVTSTDEGLMTITVSSSDSKLSADLANELFEECKRASMAIERQLILQQAGHLENAHRNSKIRLEASESRLGDFTAKYSLINLDLQSGNQLRSIRELEAQKDVLRGDLNETLINYTERSPEVQRIKARISSIDELQENARNNIVGPVGTNEYGRLMVVHESLKQRVRFERDLVATLATKADIYRIRANQPTGNLAIIKVALPPSRPAGPSKKRELGIALGLSMFLAVGWSLAYRQWNNAMKDEYISSRVTELGSLLLPPSLHFSSIHKPQRLKH